MILTNNTYILLGELSSRINKSDIEKFIDYKQSLLDNNFDTFVLILDNNGYENELICNTIKFMPSNEYTFYKYYFYKWGFAEESRELSTDKIIIKYFSYYKELN